MIPHFIDQMLETAPGAVGAYYNAYKTYRWGDPYIRLIAHLADPGRLAIDVGAHAGDYTFFMRRHALDCIAFECNSALVGQLRRRFGRSVDIRSDAVSDQDGTTMLRIPRSHGDLVRATIEVNNPLAGLSDVDLISVPTVKLDTVIDRPVGLLKVDVEGHELAVLRGALRILKADKPNLVLELEERHAPGCVAATFEFLSEIGYQGSYLRDGALVSAVAADGLAPGLSNFVFKHLS